MLRMSGCRIVVGILFIWVETTPVVTIVVVRCRLLPFLSPISTWNCFEGDGLMRMMRGGVDVGEGLRRG